VVVFVPVAGRTAQNTVSLGFNVTADAFDPAATSGPKSAAGYAAALAAEMGVDAADITVTAVQNDDGTWSVTAEVDAGEDSAGAAAAVEAFNALTPEELVSPSPSLS
jgi:3-hydroxyisobutyrate dehydrogenase-like beta-hydroxyacid dehydrogenase